MLRDRLLSRHPEDKFDSPSLASPRPSFFQPLQRPPAVVSFSCAQTSLFPLPIVLAWFLQPCPPSSIRCSSLVTRYGRLALCCCSCYSGPAAALLPPSRNLADAASIPAAIAARFLPRPFVDSQPAGSSVHCSQLCALSWRPLRSTSLARLLFLPFVSYPVLLFLFLLLITLSAI